MASLIKVFGQVRVLNNCVKYAPSCVVTRHYTTGGKTSSSSSLTESRSSQGGVSTTFQTVKETTKTAWYLSVVLGGVGVTGAIFYVIFKELFSSESPNNIFSAALDKCIENPKVQDVLGAPIKGHGEETRRGRHRHVSYQEYYDRNGRKGIKMRFYLKGSRRRATVYLEKIQNDQGKYEYEYIQVVPDNIVPLSFFVVDNRQSSQPSSIAETNPPLPTLY